MNGARNNRVTWFSSHKPELGHKLDEPLLAAMTQDVELHGVGVQVDSARLPAVLSHPSTRSDLARKYFNRNFLETSNIYHDCPDPPSFLREDAELLVFIVRHQDVTLMVRASSSWVLEESSKYFNVLHEVTAERKLEDVNCVEAGVNDNDRISKDREKSEL